MRPVASSSRCSAAGGDGSGRSRRARSRAMPGDRISGERPDGRRQLAHDRCIRAAAARAWLDRRAAPSTIEYRWGGEPPRAHCRDWWQSSFRRPVAVIVANQISALAAKGRNRDGADRVRDRGRPDQGMASSPRLNRPGGNVTGVVFFGARCWGCEATGAAAPVGPNGGDNCRNWWGWIAPRPLAERRDLQGPRRKLSGSNLVVFDAASERDIETAFGNVRPTRGSWR